MRQISHWVSQVIFLTGILVAIATRDYQQAAVDILAAIFLLIDSKE